MTSANLQPDSPCVGRCSTAYGDDICRGCGRTFVEVINWIIYDEAEKAAVWTRLQQAGLVQAASDDAQATSRPSFDQVLSLRKV